MSGIIDTVGSKSGIIGSDNYPAGHIIQTVQANLDGNLGNGTGGIPVYTDGSVTISATSGNKLLIMISGGSVNCASNAVKQLNFGIRVVANSVDSTSTYISNHTYSHISYDQTPACAFALHSVIWTGTHYIHRALSGDNYSGWEDGGTNLVSVIIHELQA